MGNTNSIRDRLHQYIEVADDKKVEALYAIMENDIASSGIEFSDDLKEELNNRYKRYKTGKSKIVTAEESKERIYKTLKK